MNEDSDQWLHDQRILDKMRKQLDTVPEIMKQKEAQQEMSKQMNEMAERRAKETDQEKWNREMGRWAQDTCIS